MLDLISLLMSRSIRICGGRSSPSGTSRLRCSAGTTSIRSRGRSLLVSLVDYSSWRRPLSFPSSIPPSWITDTTESNGSRTFVFWDIAFLCCLMRGHFTSPMTRLCVERVTTRSFYALRSKEKSDPTRGKRGGVDTAKMYEKALKKYESETTGRNQVPLCSALVSIVTNSDNPGVHRRKRITRNRKNKYAVSYENAHEPNTTRFTSLSIESPSSESHFSSKPTLTRLPFLLRYLQIVLDLRLRATGAQR